MKTVTEIADAVRLLCKAYQQLENHRHLADEIKMVISALAWSAGVAGEDSKGVRAFAKFIDGLKELDL